MDRKELKWKAKLYQVIVHALAFVDTSDYLVENDDTSFCLLLKNSTAEVAHDLHE